MSRLPTWPAVVAAFVLGFAVADLTGVRPLGGLVLAAGLGWCALRWRREAGLARAVALLALSLGAFALSHALGDALGAWPAVLLVAALAGAAAWALADAPARVGRVAH